MSLTVETSPVDKYSADLFTSLGDFWTRIYSNKDFVADLAKADSLLLAQCYLNTLELFACLSRKDIPVFHREKWFPLVIRESEANTGDGVKLYMGITPSAVLGPQPPDSVYGNGMEFHLGGNALRADFISFPVRTKTLPSEMPCICSSIIRPARVYVAGTDFYMERGSIVLRKELNPFDFPDAFIIREVMAANGTIDREIVLWGADALIDRNYIPDHFGYMQNSLYSNPEYGKEATDSVLELRASGASLWLLLKSLGRIFETAVIGAAAETVIDICSTSDGYTCVITDKATYRCRPEETLRSTIVKGAVLSQGDFLTNTVRLYRKLNPDKFMQTSGYTLEQLVADVPRLPLFKGLVHPDGLSSGISAPWGEVDITYEGDDINGNPKLKFALSGSERSVDEYWNATWNRAEVSGTDMSVVLSDYLFETASFIPGAVVGKINPMFFFMKNCVQSNLSLLVVDFDALPEYIKSLNLLYELNRVTSAYSLMLLVGRRTITEESYDLGGQRSILDAYLDLGGGTFIPKYVGTRIVEESGNTGQLNYFDTKPKFRQVYT